MTAAAELSHEYLSLWLVDILENVENIIIELISRDKSALKLFITAPPQSYFARGITSGDWRMARMARKASIVALFSHQTPLKHSWSLQNFKAQWPRSHSFESFKKRTSTRQRFSMQSDVEQAEIGLKFIWIGNLISFSSRFSMPRTNRMKKSEVCLSTAFWGHSDVCALPVLCSNEIINTRGNLLVEEIEAFIEFCMSCEKCAQVSLKSLMYIWSVSCTDEGSGMERKGIKMALGSGVNLSVCSS